MASGWIAPHLTSGLGNRLFQFAAALGAAEAWKRPIIFYIPSVETCPHGAVATIFNMFPTVFVREQPETEPPHTITEPSRRFYEHIPLGPTALSAGNIIIDGFRQSPGYFPRRLELLQPNWDHALGGAIVRRFIQRDADLATEEERRRTVSLHVRLGDYTRLPHHQVDLGAYYMRAIERVLTSGDARRIHLFSDEPERCAMMFRGLCEKLGLTFTVARIRADVESLYEMSLCRGGNITANSTFSWWGAWFAHAAGSPWATYPETMGAGMPEPVDFVPDWGTVLPCGAPAEQA